MKNPARVIERSGAMHVLVDVSQESSDTRLLTLDQMNRESANHYFEASDWLFNQ